MATEGGGLKSQLLLGAVGSLGIKIASTLTAFLLAVVLARTLGPEGYGAYAFVLSLLMLLAIPTQVGLPQLVVRETAKAQANQEWGLMLGLWRWSNRYVALFSISLIALCTSVLLLNPNGIIAGERRDTLVIGFVLIPLIALGNIRGGALRGLRRVVLGQLPESVIRPLLTLLLIGSLIWIGDLLPATPRMAMMLHVLAALTAFIVGLSLLIQARPPVLRRKPVAEFRQRYWRAAAMPLAAVAGLQLINNHSDIIMLGVLTTNEETGVYKVVIQVASLVIFGLQAVNQAIQPHFARLYARGKKKELQKLVTYSSRTILLLAILPVSVMLLWGKPLLGVLFGEEFREGALPLAILAIGQLVNAAIGSVGVLLNMTGHERDTVKGVAIAAVCNVLLNIALIPAYGPVGAATATASTLVVWNIVLWHFVHRRLNIESSALGAGKLS